MPSGRAGTSGAMSYCLLFFYLISQTTHAKICSIQHVVQRARAQFIGFVLKKIRGCLWTQNEFFFYTSFHGLTCSIVKSKAVVVVCPCRNIFFSSQLYLSRQTHPTDNLCFRAHFDKDFLCPWPRVCHFYNINISC